MTDIVSEAQKQANALERIERQASLRGEQKRAAMEFDVEVERLRGENERALAQLQQEISV